MTTLVRAMVSGKFDPPHEGHIDHIVKASKLGDELIVIAQPDDYIIKEKGKYNVPYWGRYVLLKGILMVYGIKGDVFIGLDRDGKSTESLKHFRPDVYVKGGDRVEGTLPAEEVEVCKQIGCRIVYGVGDLLNSSSKLEVYKGET